MLQSNALPGRPQRPIYQEVRQLPDAQLSIMCQSYSIFPGPISPHNRRQAERQLHIALIKERARFRARHQFAEECRLQYSGDPNFRPNPPPPQQHYDSRVALPPPAVPTLNYWPKPNTLNLRSNPPPSSSFRYRQQLQEPVLEPQRYMTWQEQSRMHKQAERKRFHKPPEANAAAEGADTSFLGFQLPFSLDTVREITTKIGETLKRFQGAGESQATTRFEGGSIKNQEKGQERSHDELRRSEVVACQKQHQSTYQATTEDDPSNDASEGEYQADESEGEDPEISEEDFNYDCEERDRDTLFDRWEGERQQQAYAQPQPFDFQELKTLAVAQAQTDLVERSSSASTATTYHDFFSQEPLQRVAGNFWGWWRRRTTAGDERIPVAEQTREREHKHEREVKSIHYLRETADDGVMEIMHRVDLRDDSEEEDLVVLPECTLTSQPSPRTYARLYMSIFRLLLCDRDAKLDPEKLRCAFLGCCVVFGIYMGYRTMR
ncbi:hypothetical protein KR059_004975 [Drosophila kikkawai]|nr:hypothetical protein KR059_004975 [Drosophila kikkawai]